MILPPFDSSYRDESNGMCFISLASILTYLRCYKYSTIIDIGARSSDWILMILPPFNSSHRDELNGMCFISLALILTELRCYRYLTIIDIGARSNDWILMIIPPIDSSHRDESNGGKIIQNESLDAELLFIKGFKYKSAKIKANSGQIFS
jgi:hypothetical protein